ncbi:unnamed protein product [Anisakis simplex]|uniref:Secreted protein n=1 Tax=Anisakis simplex TaxID=6269 RepID=A0A0M3JA41_ANISI|nr:unnamed protein product [Anisakis simplex]
MLLFFQSASRAGSHLPRIRLDGGFRSFWKHWRSNVSCSQPCSSSDSRSGFHVGSLGVMSSFRKSSRFPYVLKEETVEELRTDSMPSTGVPQRSSTLKLSNSRPRSLFLINSILHSLKLHLLFIVLDGSLEERGQLIQSVNFAINLRMCSSIKS